MVIYVQEAAARRDRYDMDDTERSMKFLEHQIAAAADAKTVTENEAEELVRDEDAAPLVLGTLRLAGGNTGQCVTFFFSSRFFSDVYAIAEKYVWTSYRVKSLISIAVIGFLWVRIPDCSNASSTACSISVPGRQEEIEEGQGREVV